MCGILGQINRSNPVDKGRFSAMLSTLAKRGPDQDGIFCSKNVALGHKRLSIVDLSESGRQPMQDENGNVVITFNGEIYNYQSLKSSLKPDYTWQSRTDTEVLINAYRELGQNVVEKIEGMFAFGIYDPDANLITCARDHFGKKPLYYYLDEDVFCFASELKAILANPSIKCRLKIDRLALAKYLCYGYIPSPDSIFTKIKKLEPATTFQFDISRWEIVNHKRFWHLEAIKPNTSIGEDDVLDRTEELIKQSVRKRLMADVPLGIFLSGGCDSSLIGALLAGMAPGSNSFTVSYKNSPDADESEYARQVSMENGLVHHSCNFEDAIVKETFMGILDYLDEPMADAAIIPLYFLSKYAQKRIVVTLSGDGGDEVFGGYPKYHAQQVLEKYRFFKGLARLAAPFIGPNNKYVKLFRTVDLDFASRQFVFGSGGFLPEDAMRLLNLETLDMTSVFQQAYKYEMEFGQPDNINKSLFLDCKIQLPDWYLVKGDRASMAASLEMRNPLLDKDLAEFVFSLEGNWKIRKGEQKYVLKKVAARHVNPDIIYRPKKGFGVPLSKWIRDDLRELFEDYLFMQNPFFNQEYIGTLHQEHLSGKVDRSFYLLRIFNFNYWLDTYVN